MMLLTVWQCSFHDEILLNSHPFFLLLNFVLFYLVDGVQDWKADAKRQENEWGGINIHDLKGT